MNILSENKYISIDANEIGKKLERYILNGNLNGLKLFSNALSVNVESIKQRILDLGGYVYMAGGDNILAEIENDNISEVINFIDKMNQNELFRFSIGVGDTPANAYIAIKYAKVNECFAIKYVNDMFFKLIENDVSGGMKICEVKDKDKLAHFEWKQQEGGEVMNGK